MTTKVSLLTTPNDFHALHVAADKRGISVKIEREMLLRLLTDHSVMSAALSQSTSHRLEEPVAMRQRLKR